MPKRKPSQRHPRPELHGHRDSRIERYHQIAQIVPVIAVFLFAQRYFIQGITMTGMKG